jgi:hypothetical protein
MSNLTPEEKADSICRWTNQGLRELVIEAIREARSEGAQVERAECAKLVSSKWHEISDRFTNSVATSRAGYHIINAIRERGNQADEKVGE